MIETKTRQIDGHSIESVQFPASKAFKYQTKILKMLAPLVSVINSASPNKSLIDQDVDLSSMSSFADRLDEEEVLSFVMTLLSTTRIDEKLITKEVFDFEFAGKLELVYKILLFVMEVNYKSFLDKSGFGKILTRKNP